MAPFQCCLLSRHMYLLHIMHLQQVVMPQTSRGTPFCFFWIMLRCFWTCSIVEQKCGSIQAALKFVSIAPVSGNSSTKCLPSYLMHQCTPPEFIVASKYIITWIIPKHLAFALSALTGIVKSSSYSSSPPSMLHQTFPHCILY